MITEVYPVIREIRHSIHNLKKWMKLISVKGSLIFIGSKGKISYEPKGVSLIISPWNFPFQLAIGPLICAISAGNCCILKPSEYSPCTAEFIRKLIDELFNENEVKVFNGDYNTSKFLLEQPFDHIFFTGSNQVGKYVMEAAAKKLIPVTLELGGKCPAIVDSTIDLKEAANKILWGKFINCGQVCVSPDYMIIPKERVDDFVNLAINTIERLYGPQNQIINRDDYCRIINEKHYYRIKALVQDAVKSGAIVECGGEFRDEDYYISPTILTNVSMDLSIMKEEIFGPVLPIMTYSDIKEAIEIVNLNHNPLAMYIFSRKKEVIDVIVANTKSGDVVINDVIVHFTNTSLPFGGFGQSGLGKSHGFFGFKAFSHERAILKQPKFTPLQLIYPPYNNFVKKITSLAIKYF